ncbi:MAG TPA: HAD-IA family hydrolase [Opitutaceae bacterium]|nr:HAD-IA family hydrolase [Opitutaceae bacterium]
MVRALIFDFDGLILDTETPLIDSYAEVHAHHGVAFDRAAFLRSVGHADYAFDPWHGFSPHADRAALEEERRIRKDQLLLQQQILPGVAALLEAGRARGLRIGLASNSQHDWVEPHLARLRLREPFEFIACRGDVPSPKPEPDLYRLVLQHFGLRGHEAIAFEDSQTGVLAAKRANCRVVAVPNASTGHHDFSPADLRVGSLAEVRLDELMTRFSGAQL